MARHCVTGLGSVLASHLKAYINGLNPHSHWELKGRAGNPGKWFEQQTFKNTIQTAKALRTRPKPRPAQRGRAGQTAA